MTATLTPEEQLVNTPDGTVLFMSRRSNLRLTKVSRYPIYGPAGQKVGETQGEVVVFRDGVFRCPKEGVVAMEDGRDADAAEVVAFLESHRLRDDRAGGFWRVDQTAPAISQDEMRTLMRLAIALDEEGLSRFIEQEMDGWGREELLETANRSLEEIQAVKAQAAQR